MEAPESHLVVYTGQLGEGLVMGDCSHTSWLCPFSSTLTQGTAQGQGQANMALPGSGMGSSRH